MTGSGLSSRPLRADALRNHHAIVSSTLYRRFAGRDELVAAVFAEYFEEAVEPLLVGAAADDDPWGAIARVVEEIARALLHRRGILRAAKDSGAFTTEVALRFIGPLQDLLIRARAAGAVRDDIEARDVPAAAVMVVATAAPFGEEVRPDRWNRYLSLVLDALAGECRHTPLPALDPPPRSEVAERLTNAAGRPSEATPAETWEP